MKTVYKCERCGQVFEDYEACEAHENRHFVSKDWFDAEDEKVIARETEYTPDLFAPSAVVVPMCRCFYDDETEEWKKETIYVKYYYTAKKAAEQVFPIDESLIK